MTCAMSLYCDTEMIEILELRLPTCNTQTSNPHSQFGIIFSVNMIKYFSKSGSVTFLLDF